MRKFTILFLIFTFSMMAFISGCSKDEGNDPTGPSIDPDDYDYYMVVSASGVRGEYIINVSPMGNNTINSIELIVDSYDVVMVNYVYMWVGTTELDEGQTYQAEAVINDVDYSFTIQTTNIPIVNWPADWIVDESTTITWSLASNAEYQELYASANDGIIYENQYTDLDASDRSHTIPANWVSANLTNYNLMLMEMNFEFDDNLIVNCLSADENDYIQLKGMSNPDKIKISKEIYKRIFSQ